MFDWQAEMSALAAAPKVLRAVAPPPPSTQQVVSFAQDLTGLVLNKGDKPFSIREIESRLQKLWKTAGAWCMMSLGRGFYEFFFALEMDMPTVWAAGTVNLKSGVLRMFEWSKDFNMHTQRNSHAQVWIRLIELPQEYRMERTLREIAGALGTPLVIDNATTKHLFGHYARILVDMDFSQYWSRRHCLQTAIPQAGKSKDYVGSFKGKSNWHWLLTSLCCQYYSRTRTS
ncbi:DUF4283 domain protein [Medicago truncatula]|uniref:DUF4283 domain protein n=1 Tax=Medicago truncatula TaxID=3880 RepID=A0A072UXX8_MEDTR|nr:DUF4283 domain protein [Medicago truncatula]